MPKTEYVYGDGTPVAEGQRVQVDNFVTEFRITVRSSGPLTGADLKRIVEAKHEVIHTPNVLKTISVCRPV